MIARLRSKSFKAFFGSGSKILLASLFFLSATDAEARHHRHHRHRHRPILCSHSEIDIEDLSISENIALTGVPFDLAFSSDRFISKFPLRSIGLGGWVPSILHRLNIAKGIDYSGDGSSDSVMPIATLSGYYVPDTSASELYYFDQNGVHTETRDAINGQLKFKFTYDSNGRILFISDTFMNTTMFKYKNNQVEITSPYGQVSIVTYDTNGFLSSVTNPNNETYTVSNNSIGQMIAFQKPGGQISEVTYDESGSLVKDLGPGGDFIALLSTSDPLTGVETITSSTALQRATSYSFIVDDSGGQEAITSQDGGLSKYKFVDQGAIDSTDSFGNKSKIRQSPDPRFGWMAPFDQSTSFIVPGSNINISIQNTKAVVLKDQADPLSLTSLSSGTVLQNDPSRTVISTFDRKAGLITSISPMNRVTKAGINSNGQTSFQQIEGLEPIFFSYDQRGRLISVEQAHTLRSSKLSYDAHNNVAMTTDSLGRRTSFEYDRANRLTKEILPDGHMISMTYDANGNMLSLTPPGKTAHSFSYNLFELIGQYLPPSLNAAISGATTYSYNLDQQLTQVHRPDGKQLSFNYGAKSGLLNSIVTAEGIFNTTYKMNSSLVNSISSPDHVVMSYQYAGSIPLLVETTGPVLSSVHYDYNQDASLASIGIAGKNNSVSRVDLKYDKDGLLTGAGDEVLSLNNVGSVSATVLGKVRESVGFDNLGRITSDEFLVNDRLISKAQFTRDQLGRILRIQNPFNEDRKDISYQYDLQGRLTEVSSKSRILRSYHYDANGNRVQVISQGKQVSAKYDAQDRLLRYGDTEYHYNANGEMITKLEVTKDQDNDGDHKNSEHHDRDRQIVRRSAFTYDSFGNLKSATLPNKKVISYILDGQNRRIGKKVNGSLVQGFIYQSQTQIAAELDSSGKITKQFIYGSKSNIPDYMIYEGRKYRVISNHIGTPLAVVDAISGKVIEQLDFDEFGILKEREGKSLLPFGFAGGLLDQDTKLTHFGARDYDAETGRWVSKDPILFGGGSTNLYSYVMSDSVNLTDPNGLFGVEIGGSLSGFFGAGAGAGGQVSGSYAGTINNNTGQLQGGTTMGASVSPSGFGASAGSSLYVSVTPFANSIADLSGPFAGVMFETPILSGGLTFSGAGPTITLGVGPTAGASIHGTVGGQSSQQCH